MGRFANAPEDLGTTYLGAPTRNQPWGGESGFEAMGRQVPMHRRAEAERHLGQMCPEWDAEKRFGVVSAMSISIEQDNTHAALEDALSAGLDVTGCYRLLAVLLCHEETADV